MLAEKVSSGADASQWAGFTGGQRLGLGSAFLAAVLTLGGCDEAKQSAGPKEPTPAHAKADNDRVFTVKTREDLKVAEELSQYFHRKADFVRVGHEITDVLETIVASDKKEHGITGSGLAEHYHKVLEQKLISFGVAYEAMLASEHYKSCKENAAFQANFAPISKYADAVKRTLIDLRDSFDDKAVAQKWEPRDPSNSQHSTMGHRAQKLVETIEQFAAISEANIVKWAGKDGAKPGVVLAMAPEVKKEAEGRGWFTASALSMTPSLMNIGGVGFSLVSINPDAFALASPNFSLLSVSTPGLEGIGNWLAPVAAEEAIEFGLAEIATDAAIGVTGVGAAESAAEVLGAAEIFEELLEGLLFFL
ncbi:MAG: hypothetical protein K1X79_10730 [Oligoflexia bacterium]|nr:hypothetical protein [Oligoflexia bacterium]